MSEHSRIVRPSAIGSFRDLLGGMQVQLHQIEAVADPRNATEALLRAAALEQMHATYIGRPYDVWRHRPELAFEINERLSRGDQV